MLKDKATAYQDAKDWQQQQPIGDVRYQAALLAVLAARFGITEDVLKTEIIAEVQKRM